MDRKCSVEGCNNKRHAKGYCSKHYLQIRKHGKILDRTRFDKNEIALHEDFAEIILYDNKHNEVGRAIIDLESVEKASQYKWSLIQGYVHNNKIGRLHRFIMDCPKDLVIDHINHNPLDNRKSNLRICTIQQNNTNKNIQSNNTSGVIGVSFDKSRNKWLVQISHKGKHIYLGRYNTIEEAIESRKRAEEYYFGEYRNKLE